MKLRAIKNKVIAMVLAVASIASIGIIPAQAASISDGGSKTVTIKMGTRHSYLETTNGNALGGESWTYTTNDDITGPAYCINWGLKSVPKSKELPVTGLYTSNPKTIGAFANGYPQRSLSDFMTINKDVAELTGLTEDEFAYATQVSIWASLGQLAVEGTSFTQGRATLAIPDGGTAQQIRTYTALSIILKNAATWTKPLKTGMSVRAEKDALGSSITLEDEKGMPGIAEKGKYGILKETIGGVEYYTRTFYATSMTSTWKNGYFIDVLAENAPSGTIFTDENNNPLTTTTNGGKTYYQVPTKSRTTGLNENGSEYIGTFKICLPVLMTPANGNVTIKSSSTITQFNIYQARNDESTEQSYVIADPMYAPMTAQGTIKWATIKSLYGTLLVQKVDGSGKPLAGASFTLIGSDGKTLNGTSDANGEIKWEQLDPNVSYTLKETTAPAGYQLASPVNVNVIAGETATVTVKNDSERYFRIKKIDKQNGYPLNLAVFRFEQIDGSYATTGTTGHDGIIEFKGGELPYGSYRVYEVNPPKGYLKDNSIQTVQWDGKNDVMLTFKDVRTPSIIIIKKDANTNVSLENAVFKVYKDGALITTVTTNNAGEARVVDLTPGYYEVEEVTAPAGYVLDSTRHGIKVDPYDPAISSDPVLVINNQAKPGLRILKYDTQNMKPLADTTFEVYKDASLIGTYTTDTKGEILLTGLEPGTYFVKEVAAPSSHTVNSTPQQIELKAGQTYVATLVFLNQLKPGIHLIKLDSETMKPLTNATYVIKKVGGSYSKEFVTDANGEIDLTKLEPGAYTVQEVKAPTGYLIDDGIRTIQINADENAVIVFTDTKKPVLEVLKFDPVQNKYLAGATFRIAKIEDGSNYLDRVTDVNGKISISDLDPGVYSVKEIAAPSGYVLNSREYHVELFPGKSSQLVVTNELKPSLKIIKVDAITGKPIKDVVFTVKKVDAETITTVTTDANGEAFLQYLDPAVYEISEKSVPNGYLLGDEPQYITLVPNKTGTVNFKNYPKPTITINKIDSITKDPIKGAKFSVVYASNNSFTGEINDLGTFYSDENGQIILTNKVDGWYRITEIEPAKGYSIKEPAVQEVFVKAGENKTLTFENTPLNAIVIKKVDANTGEVLQGAKFRLRYFSGVSGTGGTVIGEYTTSVQGTIVITGLKAGTYIVEETKAPDGYIIDDAPETVYITGKEQDVITVEFENQKDSGLIIKKLSSENNQPLAGAKFKVTTSSGAVVGNSNGEYITDSSGFIHLPGLPTDTYVVQEILAPKGYVIDSIAQTIKLKHGETHTLTFYNNPDSGLLITKYDSVTKLPLAGAVFKIINSAGTIVGNANGKYTTDKNGTIHIYDLPTDTYIVQEVSAPAGYVIDSTPQTIKIKYGETHSLEFYNAPQGGLRIVKLDEETRQPIPNVEFEVSKMNGERIGTFRTDTNGIINLNTIENGWYTVVEKKAASGYKLDSQPRDVEVKNGKLNTLEVTNRKTSAFLIHKIDSLTGKGIYGVSFLISDENRNPITTLTSDQNGYVYLPGLKDSKYLVREIEAASGYILDTTVKTFYVEYGATSEITWKNTPMQGQIQITKKSEDANAISGFSAGTLLPGATFEIYDRAGNKVDTVVTDKNGWAASKPLPLGRYTVKETIAPAYYSLNSNVINAELEFAGQIVRLEVLNKSVYVNVSVQKRGYTEVVPGQMIRYDFKSIANNSTVPLNSFYWRDTLPTDAVRLDKIITGTWNTKLNYKVVYKTNLSGGDYRTLADNLQTSKVYTLNASAAALGLSSNEYVTEYMFVFGTVPAGFSQVEAPYIYCKVLDGLAHEYRFTNKTDVGGLWGNQWIMANDRWVTIVFSKPKQLPRTGY